MLELKAHPGWDPETDIDYAIGGDFPKYYDDEDRDEDLNEKAGRLATYDRSTIKAQSVVNKNDKISADTDELTKLTKEQLVEELQHQIIIIIS